MNSQKQELFVDTTIKDCKPTTQGATDVIFSAIGPGTGGIDSFQFTEKIEKIAAQLPAMIKKGGATMANALENLTEPAFNDLPELPATATAMEVRKREMENERIWKDAAAYEENNHTVYYTLLNHCTKTFRGQIQKRSEFKAIRAAMNGVQLAQLIKKIYLSGGHEDEGVDELLSCAKAEVAMCSTIQRRDQSNADFVDSIGSRTEVIEAMGMKVGFFLEKVNKRVAVRMAEANIPDNTTDKDELKMISEMKVQEMAVVQEQYLVYLALQLIDMSRFHKMKQSMESDQLISVTKWPKTKAELIALLDQWEGMNPRPKRQQPQPQQPPATQTPGQGNGSAGTGVNNDTSKVEDAEKDASEGPSFMQQQPGTRVNSKGEAACHTCGALDHWKDECPQNKDKEGFGGMQQGGDTDSDSDGEVWISTGVNFGQTTNESEESRVYFDSCTAATTVNVAHLTGVTENGHKLTVLCNAGKMTLTKKGFLGNLPAWGREAEQGIANLISIPELEVFLRAFDGQLNYSSSGDWVLSVGGSTAVLPREERGSCKGMPYLSIKDARSIFTLPIFKKPDDQPSKVSYTQVSWKPPAAHYPKVRFVASGDSHMQSSIRGNMEGLSKKQVIGAHNARLLQACMGNLPTSKMKDLHAPTYAEVLLGRNQEK